jgi:5-methylcytosine-specific restriction endonuclease McrA
MPICNRCRNDVGLLGRLNFNSQTGRCGKCEKETNQALTHFRAAFLQASADGELTGQGWGVLGSIISQYNLDTQEAMAYVRGDALHFLERVLAFVYADGVVESHEEKNIHYLIRKLLIPDTLARPILDRVEYLKYLSTIRQGTLPNLQASVHLDSDETCHMEMSATFYKVNARSVNLIPGKFIATNKKLTFLSTAGGSEIPWKRIMRVSRDGRGVYLELSTKKGNGHYDVADPVLAELLIDTAVKIAKRQLIAPQGEGDTRHIPQHIRVSVWQRDQGKCVQCSATSYLEFDHIIPFSKGGASSASNIQLLCRKCNLSKGDRL